jgi:hypothetical protein
MVKSCLRLITCCYFMQELSLPRYTKEDSYKPLVSKFFDLWKSMALLFSPGFGQVSPNFFTLLKGLHPEEVHCIMQELKAAQGVGSYPAI